jgi:hypothetical protein
MILVGDQQSSCCGGASDEWRSRRRRWRGREVNAINCLFFPRLTSLRYSAVVRGANAYVPPGARKNATTSGTATPSSQPTPGPAAPPVAPKPAAEEAAKASEAAPPSPAPGTVTGSMPASGEGMHRSISMTCLSEQTTVQPADSLVGSFRDFVTNEKQRLTQRKQALAKSEMDKRKADLLKFSKTFKVSSPFG